MTSDAAEAPLSLLLHDEAATARLAQDVAAVLRAGDLVALSGDLGAGKTTFARALLRALAGDPALEVPSPTFPLRIDHALARLRVAHVDLYRLGDASELMELGLDEALEDGAVLVEWPEKLPPDFDDSRLDVRLEIAGSGRRAEIIAAGGSWPTRLKRTQAARAFLESSGWADAVRTPLAGDASYRVHERVAKQGATAMLMDAPARPPGPAIYDGRSYDEVAHRAPDMRAYVAIDAALRARGVRAPKILGVDLEAGLLLTEDLGAEGIVQKSGAPIMERYEAAVDLLVVMHGREWPAEAALPDGSLYRLPPYDRGALLIEISLFPDWFGGHGGEPAFPADQRGPFLAAWGDLLDCVDASTTWVMRDFHSPNILWQAGAAGTDRVGVIDFQDALIGHPAYDVASLAQDARVPLSQAQEESLKARYVVGRSAADPRFDAAAFDIAYAVMGLQRATKVLGIFTRLALAEGKPGYGRHRERLKALIRRGLSHPVLSGLRLWYEPYL